MIISNFKYVQYELVIKLYILGCDWSASDELIASCSTDATICFWDAIRHCCLRCVSDPFYSSVLVCLFNPINNNILIVWYLYIYY